MPYAVKQLEITFRICLTLFKAFLKLQISFLRQPLKNVGVLLSNERKHLREVNPNM